jgi:hypothetical protein
LIRASKASLIRKYNRLRAQRFNRGWMSLFPPFVEKELASYKCSATNVAQTRRVEMPRQNILFVAAAALVSAALIVPTTGVAAQNSTPAPIVASN